MRKVLFSFLTIFVIALAAQAQDKNEAARGRASEALAKGDTATAQKIIIDLTANMKQAPGAAAAAVPWNTFFEEIRSCGFYPQETRLECVIDIKQQGGYGGGISAFGSFEYVSFFIDWQGNGFQTTDYVGSGIVLLNDGSAGTNFAVYRDFNPPGGPRTSLGGATTTTTTNGPIYKALAKLSWAVPSITPGAPVAWGNELQFTIRLSPIR